VRKVLERAGMKLDQIDVIELNEAFAAQALAVARELGLDPDKTNPNGSGVSLGHPIGATGTILAVKALYELRRRTAGTPWSRCASAAARASPPFSSGHDRALPGQPQHHPGHGSGQRDGRK
jgi:acetyl-CoA acetyltransferase